MQEGLCACVCARARVVQPRGGDVAMAIRVLEREHREHDRAQYDDVHDEWRRSHRLEEAWRVEVLAVLWSAPAQISAQISPLAGLCSAPAQAIRPLGKAQYRSRGCGPPRALIAGHP